MKSLGGSPILCSVRGPVHPGARRRRAARLYASGRGGLRPALIYFHGGGFVLFNLDTHDAVCRALARESDAVVISVDYRLAPEHRIPGRSRRCARRHHLGWPPTRSGWALTNAGSPLLAICRRATRNGPQCAAGMRGGPALAAEVLIYPSPIKVHLKTASHREFGEGYLLTRKAMQWFTGHYIASADQASHPEVSPLLATDLTGLPPALIITAEFDPLRDEGEAYAMRLQKAGVPTIVSRYPAMIHGFVSMCGVLAGGRQALREVGKFTQSIGA